MRPDWQRRFRQKPRFRAGFDLVSFLRLVTVMAPAYKPVNRRFEVLVGRSVAVCVHPYAAWRSRSANQRALLLLAYFTVSYLLVFGLLRIASS
jgi:hypothetical protein